MAVATDKGGGGRTNWFYSQGNHWFCRTSLPSDIVIEVGGISFHLHKFPLLSKCGKIARVIEEFQNAKEDISLNMECPGGCDSFYLVARFCYDVTGELTPQNVLMAYSAAEYLEMTEEHYGNNLLKTAQSFINKVILRSWKDCVLAVQSAEQSLSKAETLPIVNKCLTALAMMVCTDLSSFGWPMMMYGSLQSPGGSILWNGINTGARIRSSVSDWWFEDISCFGVSMFTSLILIMNRRSVRPENIAGAVMYYARKYFPGLDRWHRSKKLDNCTLVPAIADQKKILESIEVLLPEKKGKSYCRFLLGLLRIAILLNVCQQCKDSLERKIGVQLELATLDGLLIPNFLDSDNLYDTDCVEKIIQHFLSSQTSSNVGASSPSSTEHPSLSPSSTPLSKVTKLIDSYLSEIASDANLKPEKLRSLLVALPESVRLLDDGLYRVLDIYLKAHPWVSENEREKLCSIINCGKLSIEACAHASQNERLPLRFTLQVLFFEQLQLRTAISNCFHISETEGDHEGTNIQNDSVGRQIMQREGWVSLVQQNRHLRVDMQRMTSRVMELEKEFTSIKQGIVNKTDKRSHSHHDLIAKLGCAPLIPGGNSSDRLLTGIVGSTSCPSPRKSIERPRYNRTSSSKHV